MTAVPDLVTLHSRFPERYPHLLASVAHDTPRARYDILFAFPGETLTLQADSRLYRDKQDIGTGDFLDAFDRDWRAQAASEQSVPDHDALPFTGGWFMFLGYELVAQIEPTVTGIRFDAAFPVACATRMPAAIIVDHVRQQGWLVCESERGGELLPVLEEDCLAPELGSMAAATPPPIVDEEEPQRFLGHVRTAQEYIRDGDVFQVNLSRLWRATLRSPVSPAALYRRLCAANPAPFAGLMTWSNDRAVISSSPERLVAVRGRRVHTRPIAGTYPRSPDAGQDRALSQDLLRHPKERAEHVMLIDLERNDLGRVCRTGSVQVSEFMSLESYRHVHHIVSEVGGELRDGITPAQVIRAVFPGGTITGCPKVRCMQIIAELEQAPRAAYTGSMGYINRDGSLDLNILIRTIMCRGPEISLRAGAGIVADSIPERELAETRAKARGMLAALGV
ncbi:aminodeoxychorismate synthase component I [Sulfuricaulis limicola]|uniref:aminodeoxychorismate synthase component I n=1 Tax=Sulfuricaulis limicola TaxID=1620215 RepID=UPI000BBAFC85